MTEWYWMIFNTEFWMKGITSCIIYFLLASCFGQSSETNITITASIFEGKKIANAPIVILADNDTIFKLLTDSEGKVVVNTTLLSNRVYNIVLFADSVVRSSAQLYKQADIEDYVIDMVLPRKISCRFDSALRFKLNDVSDFSHFNVSQLKSFMDENPIYYYEFHQTVYSKESMKIALKRRQNFIRLLEKEGVNMKNIVFPKAYHINQDDLKAESIIEGVAGIRKN